MRCGSRHGHVRPVEFMCCKITVRNADGTRQLINHDRYGEFSKVIVTGFILPEYKYTDPNPSIAKTQEDIRAIRRSLGRLNDPQYAKHVFLTQRFQDHRSGVIRCSHDCVDLLAFSKCP